MRIPHILVLNVLGLAILFSWLQTVFPVWPRLDNAIFFGFNATYTPAHPVWDNVMAALNTRYYDVISFLLMLLVLFLSMREDSRTDRVAHWFSIGVMMVVTAVVIALFNHKIVNHFYAHPSPTYTFRAAGVPFNHLTQLVSFSTKDMASSSFPGDHGMLLMVFAAFILRFSTRRWKVTALLMVILLSAPRIMVGAHWFMDVWMGSLSIALVLLPWWLMTPLGPLCVEKLEKILVRFRLFAPRTS